MNNLTTSLTDILVSVLNDTELLEKSRLRDRTILLTAYWLPQNLKKQAIAAQRRKTA